MITTAQNLGGGEEVVIIEKSRRNEDNLHVRSPRVYELNEDQALALIDVLTSAVDEMWEPRW